MKNIIFVIGPACSGKSTYINKYYPNYKKIDLYDYQSNSRTIPDILKSYEECKKALIEALKENDNVILEHTLLRTIRREPYIQAVREITTDPINCIVMYPSPEILVKNSEKRKLNFNIETAKNYLNTLELPTNNDGFNKIDIITSFEV